MNSEKSPLEKSKVDKKKKKPKLRPSHGDRNSTCKPAESKNKKPKQGRDVEEALSKISFFEPKIVVSAQDIEQLKRTEVEVMHRIGHLKNRLKQFEKRLDDFCVNSDNTGKLCCAIHGEAVPVHDSAVQTSNLSRQASFFRQDQGNVEKIDAMKQMMEQLNLKLAELMEISKINQFLNARSQSGSSLSENSQVEIQRSIDHLERRIDRLIETVERQERKTPHMRVCNFPFGEFGDCKQVENRAVKPVEVLYSQSSERLAQKTKKLQPVLIINEPIISQPFQTSRKISRTRLISKRSVTSQTTNNILEETEKSEAVVNHKSNKKKQSKCFGGFFSRERK